VSHPDERSREQGLQEQLENFPFPESFILMSARQQGLGYPACLPCIANPVIILSNSIKGLNSCHCYFSRKTWIHFPVKCQRSNTFFKNRLKSQAGDIASMPAVKRVDPIN
jgi:hypothetical protein